MPDFFKKKQFREEKVARFTKKINSQLNNALTFDRQTNFSPACIDYLWLPIQFFTFAGVGLTGAAIHLLFLALLHQWFLISFMLSQAAATFIAMTSNYFLNNYITFKHRCHLGKQQFAGLLSFYLSCSIGTLINLQCAHFLYHYHFNWAVAGLLAGMSGALWNFFAATVFTWKRTSK